MNALTSLFDVSVSISFPLFLGGVLVLVAGVLLFLLFVVLQFNSKLRNLSYPIYDQIVKNAQKKALLIIEEAEEQSRAIRARAEMNAGKTLADRKRENEEFKKEHARQITELAEHGKSLLKNQTASIEQASQSLATEFEAYAKTARASLGKESERIKEMTSTEIESMKTSLAEIRKRAEVEYEALIQENRKHVTEALSQEIKLVRDVVSNYRTDRLKLVDEEIVGLVEETTKHVLGKALSLDEHKDVVLDSLRDAKKEGVFKS